MLSFISLSDTFDDSISQATIAQGYNDEESFELMNFRIKGWMKKAVPDCSLARLQVANPMSQPPTWKVLLSLRAESVRSLLFKPYFFSKADVQMSKQYVQPAIEVLFDICNVLYNLNTTDVYRKQQPFYHPLLASASGLGIVLTAFLQEHKSALLASISTKAASAMGRSYEMAVVLATGYAKKSRAARELSERLHGVRTSLLSLGMIRSSNFQEKSGQGALEWSDDRLRSLETTQRRSQRGGFHDVDSTSQSRIGPAKLGHAECVLSSIPCSPAESGWGELLGIGCKTGGSSGIRFDSIF